MKKSTKKKVKKKGGKKNGKNVPSKKEQADDLEFTEMSQNQSIFNDNDEDWVVKPAGPEISDTETWYQYNDAE